MRPIVVAPSVLAADFSKLGEEIRRVESAGADWLHIDVMDGHFVENLSMGTCVMRGVRKCAHVPLDVHLMITNPDRHLDRFIDEGASVVTFHVEVAEDPLHLIERIRKRGARAGVSISPETPVERILPLAGEADLILVMTVHPGRGGQPYIEAMEPKIQAVRERGGPDLDVEVDGGIDERTAARAAAAGANVHVAGTSIFGAPDAVQAIRSIRGAATGALGRRQ